MPKLVDKSEKKNQILFAGLKAFSEKGYHLTKMEDIALKAKIGKSTIYEYFKNKEEILLFSLDFFAITTFYNITQIVENKKFSLKEKIHRLISIHQKDMEEYDDLVIIYIELLNSTKGSFNKKFRFKLKEAHQKILLEIQKIFTEAKMKKEISSQINPKIASNLIINGLDGICQNNILFSYPKNFLNQLYSEFEKLFLIYLQRKSV